MPPTYSWRLNGGTHVPRSSVDAELGYGRPAEKKRPEEGGGKGEERG